MRLGITVEDAADLLISKSISESIEESIFQAQLANEEEIMLSPLEDQLSFGGSLQSIKGLIGKRFTDEGAKAYTQAARYEFQKHAAIKGLDLQHALQQLPCLVLKHQGSFEFVGKILMGKHILTGEEMLFAITETGNCPMLHTLQEWSGDPLPALGKVFVEAIEV